MSLTEFLDGSGNDLFGRSRKKAYFDFVIAERSRYIPNSGPPLEPLSIMPAHDKDGVIEDEIARTDGSWFYVVTYPNQPVLRVSVKPQNILKWVSRRTLENWNIKESVRNEKLRQDAEREARLNSSRSVSEVVKPKQRRKRKRGATKGVPVGKRRSSATLAGPARMRQMVEEETAVFTSPTKSQKSKGPSLTSPQVHIPALASLQDVATEDEDDELAIVNQLSFSPRGFNVTNSRSGSVTSTEELPRRSSYQKEPPAISTPRPQTQSPSSQPASSQEQGAASPFFSSRNPTAVSSSRDAFQEYERMERQSHAKEQSSQKKSAIADRYSSVWKKKSPVKGPTMFNINKTSQGSPLKSVHKAYERLDPEEDVGEELGSEDEEPAEEDEWELEDILDDDKRIDDQGVLKMYYLIKWAGDWDDTWEPAGNLKEFDITRYLSRKQAKKSRSHSQSEDRRLGNMKGIGNGKENAKGLKQRSLHEGDDMEEDGSLFGTPRKPIPHPESQGLFVSDDETASPAGKSMFDETPKIHNSHHTPEVSLFEKYGNQFG
jgi:hypothetical protein